MTKFKLKTTIVFNIIALICFWYTEIFGENGIIHVSNNNLVQTNENNITYNKTTINVSNNLVQTKEHIVTFNKTTTINVSRTNDVINIKNNNKNTNENKNNVWILSVRVQKAGSSSLEVFIQSWLKRHRKLECPPIRFCKTVHPNNKKKTWNKVPSCSCKLIEKNIVKGNTHVSALKRAKQCHAVNGIHADFVDISSYFLHGGSCKTEDKSGSGSNSSISIGSSTNNNSDGGQGRGKIEGIITPTVQTINNNTIQEKQSSSPKFIILTMVRDPVNRVNSEFNHIKNKNISRMSGWDYGCDNIKTIDDFLTNPECSLGSSNRQTRMIAGHGSNNYWQDIYDSPQSMLEMAKYHLREYIHFGIVEYSAESFQLLEHVLSEKASSLVLLSSSSKNVSSSSSSDAREEEEILVDNNSSQKSIDFHENKHKANPDQLSESLRVHIEQLNSLDRELYEYSKTLFWERFCASKIDMNHEMCHS